MTVVNYTATNKIVESGLAISDVDISLLASDDSFNSVTSILSGLLASDWVLVSGSAVDDGWHQLDVDSTANKIVTLSALTDEIAGSIVNVTGYKHGINQSYDLEFPSSVLDPKYTPKTNKVESLSGKEETLFFNEVETWNITSGIITEDELLYWLEFFASVRAGEHFSIDLYGTVSAPDNVKSCKIEGVPTISRIQSLRKYTASFEVRML